MPLNQNLSPKLQSHCDDLILKSKNSQSINLFENSSIFSAVENIAIINYLLKKIKQEPIIKKIKIYLPPVLPPEIFSSCIEAVFNLSLTEIIFDYVLGYPGLFGKISNCSILENLIISSCSTSLNEADFDAIMGFVQSNLFLQKLTLSGIQMNDKRAQQLVNILINNKNTQLRVLDLSYNPQLLNVNAIAELIKNNHSLEALYLKSCFLKGDDDIINMIPMTEALKNNESLLTLDLGENYLSQIEQKKLFDSLAFNHTLTKLLLNALSATYDDRINIFAGLRHNNTLNYFSFQHNKLPGLFFKYFANAIYNNTSLKIVEFDNTSMRGDGLIEFANVLNTTRISELSLESNKIDYFAIKEFSEKLKKNNSLEKIYLEGNDFDTKKLSWWEASASQLIAESLKNNQTLNTVCLYGSFIRYNNYFTLQPENFTLLNFPKNNIFDEGVFNFIEQKKRWYNESIDVNEYYICRNNLLNSARKRLAFCSIFSKKYVNFEPGLSKDIFELAGFDKKTQPAPTSEDIIKLLIQFNAVQQLKNLTEEKSMNTPFNFFQPNVISAKFLLGLIQENKKQEFDNALLKLDDIFFIKNIANKIQAEWNRLLNAVNLQDEVFKYSAEKNTQTSWLPFVLKRH